MSSTHRPSMDQILPVELTRLVCSFLPTSALRQVRLTNRFFAKVGAEFLIPRVCLTYTVSSISKLKEISMHSIFSLYVKSLLYEDNRLSREGEWSEYLHNIADKSLETIPARDHWFFALRHLHLGEESDEGVKEFQKHFMVCENAGGWELRNMEVSQAIARFPQLKEIHLSLNHGLSYPLGSPSDMFGGPSHRLHGTNRFKRLQPPEFCALNSLMLGLILRNGQDLVALTTPGDKMLLGPAGGERRVAGLRTLHLGFLHCYLFTLLASSFGERVSSMMKTVRDLKIVINADDLVMEMVRTSEEPPMGSINCDHLRRFLAEASSLEKLEVGVGECYHDWLSTRLPGILGNSRWRSLKSIALSGFVTEPDYLVDFFRRHHGTLECITMEDFVLVKPNGTEIWAQFLLDVRNVKQWRQVEVYGLLDHDDGHGHDFGLYLPSRGEEEDEEGLDELSHNITSFVLRRTPWNPLIHGKESLKRTAYDASDAPDDEDRVGALDQ